MYYEVRVKVPVENAKGQMEIKTRTYLTDCATFSEAETAGLSVSQAEDVVAVYRSDVYEIVNPTVTDGDYYKATIMALFTTQKGGTKEQRYKVLVNAADLQNATNIVREYMRQGLEDMMLDKVEKSKIVEVV